jgi:hypothetical protein
MRRILLFLALLASAGCGDNGPPTHGKVGALAPGQFRTIPASYDPSVTGYPGAVGDIVQNAGSTSAWVRSGPNNTDWQSFPTPSNYPAGDALILSAYRTAVVDLTQPGTYAFDMPIVAGSRFAITGTGRLEMRTRDATLTTGLTFNIAQNGIGLVGTTAQALTTALLNTWSAPAMLNGNPVSMTMPDMSTFPLQFQITTGVAGSGLTTCTGRFVILGYYTP